MTAPTPWAVLAWIAVAALSIIMLSAARWVAITLAADAKKNLNNRQI